MPTKCRETQPEPCAHNAPSHLQLQTAPLIGCCVPLPIAPHTQTYNTLSSLVESTRNIILVVFAFTNVDLKKTVGSKVHFFVGYIYYWFKVVVFNMLEIHPNWNMFIQGIGTSWTLGGLIIQPWPNLKKLSTCPHENTLEMIYCIHCRTVIISAKPSLVSFYLYHHIPPPNSFR